MKVLYKSAGGNLQSKSKYYHECREWDGLEIDETCEEFGCCFCFKETKEVKQLKEVQLQIIKNFNWDEFRRTRYDPWGVNRMYVSPNFPTKKSLREAIKRNEIIRVWLLGPFPSLPQNGLISIEGPHYPKPRSWYARVEVVDGRVIREVQQLELDFQKDDMDQKKCLD